MRMMSKLYLFIICLITSIVPVILSRLKENIAEDIKAHFGPSAVCTFLVSSNWPKTNMHHFNIAGCINGVQIPNNASLKNSNCVVALNEPSSIKDQELAGSKLQQYATQERLVVSVVKNVSGVFELIDCKTKGYLHTVFYNLEGLKLGDSNSLCRKQQKNIIGGTLDFFPYVFHNEKGQIDGADIRLANIIWAKMNLNITYQKEFSPIVMVNEVRKNKYDIGISALIMTRQRHQEVDFSFPIFNMEFVYKSGRPKEISSYETLLIPFDVWIWLYLLISCVCVCMLLTLGDKVLTHDNKLFEYISIPLLIILQQSMPRVWLKKHDTWSKVVLFSFWLTMSTVLGSAYKSNLLSILTIKRYEKPIEGPQEILGRDLTLFLPDNVQATKTLFAQSSIPEIRQMYQTATVEKDGFYKLTGGRIPAKQLNPIQNGDGVTYWARFAEQLDGHNYYYSKKSISFEHTAHMIPKGHWLKKSYNKYASWLINTGVYNHLFSSYLGNGLKSRKYYSNANLNILKLSQISITYFIVCFGLGLGCLAFLAELFYSESSPVDRILELELENNASVYKALMKARKTYRGFRGATPFMFRSELYNRRRRSTMYNMSLIYS